MAQGKRMRGDMSVNWTVVATAIALGGLLLAQGSRFTDVLIETNGARIDDANARINATNARIDRLEDKMDARFDEVDERFDEVDAKIEKVDAKVGKVDQKLDLILVALARHGISPAEPVSP